MKIALIGYGKMGRMVEEIALSRGHEVVARIDVDNLEDFDSEAFRGADVAIEFTRPESAEANVRRALAAGVPVVSGTTGWSSALPAVQELCRERGGSLIWASNFSVGMNIFMEVNRRLAHLMRPYPQYTPSMTEVHHVHKLDHPSGTAVTLAEDLLAEAPALTGWGEDTTDPALLSIHAIREGEVPGIHTVTWESDVDLISITHSAKSRRGFALGAVLAAEWLPSHPGVHSIREVLLSDL